MMLECQKIKLVHM